MEKEFTEVYCGGGKGKTTLAIGQCLRASAQGKSVIIIQFLKGRERRELDFLEELDNLDIKIFRFAKHDEGYEELNEQEKAEEKTNILNALNFARKVIATQECDFLLLDEILALPDYGITTAEATDYLMANGVTFMPGKAANAGGVATSALEMCQNSARLSWTAEEVDTKLHQIMVDIFHKVDDASKRYDMEGNYVAGANIAGFEKVVDAMIAQGIV